MKCKYVRRCQCNSCLVALHQVTLITPRRPSTETPACQSRTRPTPMATSAETAPHTRTRTSRTRSPHSRRRRRWRRHSCLRRPKLRQTSCRPRPRPPSRAYIPGTGVEGPRRVSGRAGPGWAGLAMVFPALNYGVLKHSSRLCPGVLSSLCSTCVRYGKGALAPVVSLVTLLFSSVLWLRSKAKSPQGEGMKQVSFALHHSDS